MALKNDKTDGRIRAMLVTFQQYTMDGSVRLRPVGEVVSCREDGSDMRNTRFVYECYDEIGHPVKPEGVQDFRVTGLMKRDDGGRPWSMGYAYEEPREVHLGRAEAMVATLRRVHRGMEILRDRDGYPDSFGVYVARVAKLIGATRIIVAKNVKMESGGYDKNRDNYIMCGMGVGTDLINDRLRIWDGGTDEVQTWRGW